MVQRTHTIPDLDRKGLRDFGLVTGSIVAVLFGLFFPWLLKLQLPVWPWVVFGVLGLWALSAPLTLRPVYRLWMRFGLLMSRITTPVILGIVFFLVLMPTALIMRVIRFDPLARRMDRQADSYRVESRKPSREHMERPF